MHYPNFFDDIPSIELSDPLSAILGTFEQGEYFISYLDLVKGSGHSCPSIAGAYLMSFHALKELYPDSKIQRGNIRVDFNEDITEGTTGVVANVISYITGATDKSGFKGLNGNFIRHSLMHFNAAVASIRFTRIDTQVSVDVFYDASVVPADEQLTTLMKTLMQGKADKKQKQTFARLWQERVKSILIDNFDNDKLIHVKRA